jgi:hypothetical protein
VCSRAARTLDQAGACESCPRQHRVSRLPGPVIEHCRRSLARRNQKGRVTGERTHLLAKATPTPHATRAERQSVDTHAGICAGDRWQWLAYRDRVEGLHHLRGGDRAADIRREREERHDVVRVHNPICARRTCPTSRAQATAPSELTAQGSTPRAAARRADPLLPQGEPLAAPIRARSGNAEPPTLLLGSSQERTAVSFAGNVGYPARMGTRK